VELVSFTAKVIDQSVMLEWKTASELDNDYFEVERFSADDEEILVLGKAPGHGTTREFNNYLFVDQEPLNGRAYYRLKQVDFNGEYKYSPVITATYKDVFAKRITLFPNPGDGTELGISLNYQGTVSISIYNAQGSVVESAVVQLGEEGGTFRYPMKSKLSPGVYFVRLEQNSGTLVRKWIVK